MLRIILVTAPADKAEELARVLLEERLIACANLLPGIKSIYRWKGKLETDTESLLILKTPKGRVDALMARVAELHPYEVPEILALEVERGHPPYLAWAEEETRPVL